jgi:hypothetical protein
MHAGIDRYGAERRLPNDTARHEPAASAYAYRIMTSQGTNAEGGARSYLLNGRLTEGYAVVAWPTRPGDTGLSTFIMNQQGVVFERVRRPYPRGGAADNRLRSRSGLEPRQ